MLFPFAVDHALGTDTPPPPLTITAAQARQLRDGSAEVWDVDNPKHENRMQVHAAFRVPSPAAEARAQLGQLKVVGPTIVDGRSAIKLVPIHGTWRVRRRARHLLPRQGDRRGPPRLESDHLLERVPRSYPPPPRTNGC